MIRNKLCTSRWGTVLQSTVDDTRLQGLVLALVVNDIPAARVLLECCSDGFFNKRICCGWSGVRMFPIEALIVGAAREEEKIELATLLAKHQASMNVLWTEATDEHTPLSRALSLRQFKLAAALVSCGASPATALLETSLLEATRFDPSIVRWLLDAGADMSVPPVHAPRSHCHGAGGTSSAWAVVSVLAKCGLELHVLRQLHSLDAVPRCSTQEGLILQRVALILSMLLAAGAPPLRSPVGMRQQPAMAPGAAATVGMQQGVAVPSAVAAAATAECLGQATIAAAAAGAAAPAVAPTGAGGAVLSLLELRPLLLSPSAHQEETGAGPPSLPGQRLLRPHSGELPPALGQLRVSQSAPHSAAQGAGGSQPPPFGFQPAEWAFLRPYATQVPEWSPSMHWLFPEPVRAAIWTFVMISSCRGFPAAGCPTAAPLVQGGSQSPQLASLGTSVGLMGQDLDLAQAASSGADGALLPVGAGGGTAGAAGGVPACTAEGSAAGAAGGGAAGSGSAQEQGQLRGAPASPWRQRSQPQQAQREGEMVVWLDANVLDMICRHLAKVWYQFS